MPPPDLAERSLPYVSAAEPSGGGPPSDHEFPDPHPPIEPPAYLRPVYRAPQPRIPPDIETSEAEAPPGPVAPRLQRRTHSFFKAVTWRATATIDTFIISYLVTGRLKDAGAIVSLELVTKILYYYIHERVWARVSFWLERRHRTRPGTGD